MTSHNPVLTALSERRAVRDYDPRPIPPELLSKVAHAALEAPSSFNCQLRFLVVVTDPDVKQAIFEATTNQQHFLTAPAILVCGGRTDLVPADATDFLLPDKIERVRAWRENLGQTGRRDTAIRDGILLASWAMIAAEGLGLATCPTTGWDEQKVKRAIGLGDDANAVVAMCLPMGYPASRPVRPPRLSNRIIADSF